jgi:hypothetical protein
MDKPEQVDRINHDFSLGLGMTDVPLGGVYQLLNVAGFRETVGRVYTGGPFRTRGIRLKLA